MSTEKKTIILTGASRGIGLAIARTLLKAGHNVFCVARTAGPMEELKKQFPGQVEFLAGDLGDLEVGPRAISSCLSTFTTLHALIINHGALTPTTRISDSSPAAWATTLNINFISAISLIQPAIPALRATKGIILLTSSGAAASAYTTWGAYGSSKAALNHLALTLAHEEPLITSLAIRPGVVDTEMQVQVRAIEGMSEKEKVKFKGLFEKGGLVKADDVGGVMARLAVAEEGKGLEGLSGRFLSWDSEELKAFRT